MKVLIVDDEKNLRGSIAEFLELEKIGTYEAANGLSAQRMLQEEVFDAVVLDLRMPGMTGLELLGWIRESGPDVPVIMISAYGEVNDAVEAMRRGANDYLVKPFDPEELVIRLRRAVDERQLRERVELGRRTADHASGSGDSSAIDWVGESEGMREIERLVLKVAPTPSTILITGESGTGKEVIARNIHRFSKRKDGPFTPINLGGIPETLLESELFGYEKGAFTGADRRKEGLFELASGGTLFLDEIGEMPVHLQVKLLRVLQEKRIQRLGGSQTIPIDVRIIAATNRNLEDRVRDGAFREDLFYRLNVIRIEVPPLRERPGDIPLLAGYFIQKFDRELGRTVKGLTPGAVRALQSYDFRGNVRELENLMERALILSENEYLDVQDFAIPRADGKSSTVDVPEMKPGSVKELEKQAIVAALRRWEGRRIKAADELGISRRTLLNKIKEYGLDNIL